MGAAPDPKDRPCKSHETAKSYINEKWEARRKYKSCGLSWSQGAETQKLSVFAVGDIESTGEPVLRGNKIVLRSLGTLLNMASLRAMLHPDFINDEGKYSSGTVLS